MSTDGNTEIPSTEGSPGGDQFLADESWQPGEEDMLLDTPTDDVLDEGLTAPDEDPLAGEHLTPAEMEEGDTIDERVAREEPEVWEQQGPDAEASPHAGPGPMGEPAPDNVADAGVGRLVAEPDDDDPTDQVGEEQDVMAEDVGVDAARFLPEEAAMHITDGDDLAVDEGSSVEPDDADLDAAQADFTGEADVTAGEEERA
ncbi:DUF5709 domain-containing protein [Georgenia thermotolerans]|uniref:DUF5709 domain-containing protein n=1 Tax=Georgenia thermotolerans TaxID=527326 RepID=A0A7J5UL77_9MICO|nr:DUF5709 domain-containing protein [Georgenia thermotolerans]KAE8762914.1 hypothetical protein GB883_16920 [Georgenia thermotolerans]